MAATTRARPGSRRPVHSIDLPVKAATKILGGTHVCTDASGWAVPATSATALRYWGTAQRTVDNTDGANGDLLVNARLSQEIEVELWHNDTGTALVAADRGKRAYLLDNQTLTANSTGKSPGPYVYEVTSEGVWAWSDPAANAVDITALQAQLDALLAADVPIEDAGGLYAAENVEAALAEVKAIADAGVGVVKRSVTIDVTADNFAGLANGVQSFTKALSGGAIPANARFFGAVAHTLTGFDNGGGGATYSVKVGSASDDDAVISALNVATGQSGFPKTGTLGARGFAACPLYAEVHNAIISSDADLNDATAGAITIDLFYLVKA